MLFPFTLHTRLITLLSLFVYGVFTGPCMPCRVPNRRATWDQRLSPRGLYIPKITNPTDGTIWNTGSDVVVTWDVRDMPDKTSNQTGTLLLGYLEDDSTDEHLNTEHPLASGFNMDRGSVNFRCPKVEPRKNYIIVLIGDSGNRSPLFTIKK